MPYNSVSIQLKLQDIFSFLNVTLNQIDTEENLIDLCTVLVMLMLVNHISYASWMTLKGIQTLYDLKTAIF